MKNDMILDKEELELLNELEGESFVDIPLTKSEKENYTSYAKYTKSLQEKKQTTIRFSVSDLAIVKSKAKEMQAVELMILILYIKSLYLKKLKSKVADVSNAR